MGVHEGGGCGGERKPRVYQKLNEVWEEDFRKRNA